MNWLQERLKQPLPGALAHEKMMARVREMPEKIPDNARASAVMSLLFPKDDGLNVLLIQRTEDGRAHSGQISFPGGRQDPGDADLRATALREAQEEVGIVSREVTIIGALSALYIPVSNFLVYPFVAFARKAPVYNISTDEVARVIEMPVSDLFGAERKTVATVTSPADRSFRREVRAYRIDDQRVIWGATAMILSELEMLVAEGPF